MIPKYRVYIPDDDLKGIYPVHRLDLDIGRVWFTHPEKGECIASLDECTLMQGSGVIDNQGNEIFAGDIIKYGNSIREVVFLNGRFCTIVEQYSKTVYDLCNIGDNYYRRGQRIVGNKFMDPELLSNK